MDKIVSIGSFDYVLIFRETINKPRVMVRTKATEIAFRHQLTADMLFIEIRQRWCLTPYTAK